MKKKWTTEKILALAGGISAAVIIFIIALFVSLYQFYDTLFTLMDSDEWEISEHYEYEEDDEDDKEYSKRRKADEYGERDSEEIFGEEFFGDEFHFDEEFTFDEEYEFDEEFLYGQEYYEFGDAVRDDLPYSVTFEIYERDDFLPEEDGNFHMEFRYPVIAGEVPNLEGINRTLQQELIFVEEHVEEIAQYLGSGDYEYTTTGYVTYMSEEVLSVIYVEYVYLEEEFLESYVICVNVDMETGMVLKNSQLLEVDDDFSVEFRKRSDIQNGEISDVTAMSDQEITSYLTDEDWVIAFYTPLGMEIGFNYYDGWVTVTYSDYQKYQKQF